MIDTGRAIETAMNEFKNEYGQDVQLEEGELFVTVFANATLVIGLEDREMSVKMIGGRPYTSDEEIDMFVEEKE